MINKILTGIFKIIISLVNVLLTPINELITNAIPSLTTAFTTIHSLFTLMFQFISWWVDACLLSSETISLIIACLTIRLTLPYAISAIKLCLKWYNSLKV